MSESPCATEAANEVAAPLDLKSTSHAYCSVFRVPRHCSQGTIAVGQCSQTSTTLVSTLRKPSLLSTQARVEGTLEQLDDDAANSHLSALGRVFTVFAQEHVGYTSVKVHALSRVGTTVLEL